ncbi:hypothetical protein GCM10010421_07940 [Streptomyces glaucus]|uniref:Secreted protein n=1 Tax=Streptomyces glaucus TaxID=284029 RepID=A0ABP5WE21_9ACTN
MTRVQLAPRSVERKVPRTPPPSIRAFFQVQVSAAIETSARSAAGAGGAPESRPPAPARP